MKFNYNNSKMKDRRKVLRSDMTKPEQVLWYWLRTKYLKGYKFRRQYSVGYYILDFYCPKLRLGIEVDGDSHFDSKAMEYDQQRDDFLKGHNIEIIRFTNKEVMENIEGVLEKIMKFYLPSRLSG